jgi:hypothetical protein
MRKIPIRRNRPYQPAAIPDCRWVVGKEITVVHGFLFPCELR